MVLGIFLIVSGTRTRRIEIERLGARVKVGSHRSGG